MLRIRPYRLTIKRAIAAMSLPLTALFAVQSALAQGLPLGDPEMLGISPERLERVDAMIESAVEDETISGAVALIARRGRVAYLEAIGMADIDDREPMQIDTLFRIASMTKPVTSLAVMMLLEEGHFLLTDPVSRFIPELGEPEIIVVDDSVTTTVAANGEITIQHLLTHTSGIIYQFSAVDGAHAALAGLYREAGVSDGLVQTEGRIADLSRQLGTVPLLFEPGTDVAYGLSTDVLGHLVEAVSGMTLANFFERRIFEPLGMRDTRFFLDPADADRLASVYVPDGQGGLRELSDDETVESGFLVYSASYSFKGPRTYHSGGAGLVSNVSDYARLMQMFLNGGELDGVRLLSPKNIELMTSNGIGALDFGLGRKFGLGFAIIDDPGRAGFTSSRGSYYWGGFFNTRFFVDPEEEFIGIFLSQRFPRDESSLRDRFVSVAYQAIVD
jgi:CubicO group peptidase (beta-lactamase class C family)